MLLYLKHLYGFIIVCAIVACNNNITPVNNITEQNGAFSDTLLTKNSKQQTHTNALLMLDSLANSKQSFNNKYLGLKEIFSRTQLLSNSLEDSYLFPDRFEYSYKEFLVIYTDEIRIGIYYYEYEDTAKANNVKDNWLACYGKNCDDVINNITSQQNSTDNLSAVTYVYKNIILHIALLSETNNSETDKWLSGISNVFKHPKSARIKSFNFKKHILQ